MSSALAPQSAYPGGSPHDSPSCATTSTAPSGRPARGPGSERREPRPSRGTVWPRRDSCWQICQGRRNSGQAGRPESGGCQSPGRPHVLRQRPPGAERPALPAPPSAATVNKPGRRGRDAGCAVGSSRGSGWNGGSFPAGTAPARDEDAA